MHIAIAIKTTNFSLKILEKVIKKSKEFKDIVKEKDTLTRCYAFNLGKNFLDIMHN